MTRRCITCRGTEWRTEWHTEPGLVLMAECVYRILVCAGCQTMTAVKFVPDAKDEEAMKTYAAAFRTQRAAEGRCITCGDPMPESSKHPSCKPCRVAAAARMADLRARRRAEG
jgi:hypothetical protein